MSKRTECVCIPDAEVSWAYQYASRLSLCSRCRASLFSSSRLSSCKHVHHSVRAQIPEKEKDLRVCHLHRFRTPLGYASIRGGSIKQFDLLFISNITISDQNCRIKQ